MPDLKRKRYSFVRKVVDTEVDFQNSVDSSFLLAVLKFRYSLRLFGRTFFLKEVVQCNP